MTTLRGNKSFQFIVGVGVLYFAFQLWTNGYFDVLFRAESEGFESGALLPLLLSAAVSAVQMVGLLAILIVSNVLPLLKPVGQYLLSLIDTLVNKLPTKIASKINKVEAPEIDVDKLIATLNDLDARIRNVEEGK